MGPAVISPRTPLSPAGAQACGAALSAPHSCCCLRYGRKRLWEAAGARPQQHRGPSVIYPRPWLRASPLREEKLRPRRRLALQPSGTPGSGAGGPLPPHEVAPRGPPPPCLPGRGSVCAFVPRFPPMVSTGLSLGGRRRAACPRPPRPTALCGRAARRCRKDTPPCPRGPSVGPRWASERGPAWPAVVSARRYLFGRFPSMTAPDEIGLGREGRVVSRGGRRVGVGGRPHVCWPDSGSPRTLAFFFRSSSCQRAVNYRISLRFKSLNFKTN